MKKWITLYQVGGSVRDQLLGIPHHDIDYAVEAPSFSFMKRYLEEKGYTIFVEKPQYFVIKAKHPSNKFVADFVLCRKDGYYSNYRYPDKSDIGKLSDDLARRDFTINAIAIEEGTDKIIDPHNGRQDIRDKIIRCVGDTKERLLEDPLRILRAIRFSITKEMTIHKDIIEMFDNEELIQRFESSVSIERVQHEMHKMFQHNTVTSLKMLSSLNSAFIDMLFNKGLWLKPTLERKKRI